MKKTKFFPVSDFFDIKKGKRLTKADMIPGNIPFIGSSADNNGVTAFVGNADCLHDAGTITVSYNGSVGEVFLQDYRFWASDDVNVWYPKQKMKLEVKLYLMAVIKKLAVKYSYTNKWTIDKMRSELLELPVKASDEPDFEYMENRIADIVLDQIVDLDCYLKSSGLSDIDLPDVDKEFCQFSFEAEDKKRFFKNYQLGQLFDSATGDVDLQQKDINGKGEYFINSGLDNLGIKGRTDRSAKIFPANTITIDFWGNAFYRDFEYKLATHNHVFSLSGDVIKNRQVGLYIVSTLAKLPHLFSYSNMATWNKLKTIKICLPVLPDGQFDFAYMESYIETIEKGIIADVVRYKDKVLAAA